MMIFFFNLRDPRTGHEISRSTGLSFQAVQQQNCTLLKTDHPPAIQGIKYFACICKL